MNIFSQIFSVCFLILGAMVWAIAMLTVIIGSIGLLRIAISWSFDVDIVKKWGERNVHK